MASITAVELGADICALARTDVRRRGAEVRLLAAEILDPAAFPGIEAFTMAVRQTRQANRMPRRCRVVVWGLPDGANRRDAAVKPLLEPLTGAGFKVERVVSPCNALAALARLKSSRGEGSTCWIAINRGGVAIVVVRPGKQLYAHSFVWDSQVGASGSQARLLQRYSLVSFLSPEVKRAMAEARKFGTPVDVVITCGNLPDLRSLTMPLIEELDVEVETLDSLEGLVVKPQLAEKLAEMAPAIRLACAAGMARGSRPWDPSKNRTSAQAMGGYLRAAALAVAVVGVGYLWFSRSKAPAPNPIPPPRVEARASAPPAVAGRAPAVSDAAKKPASNPPAVSDAAKKPALNPPAVSDAAKKPASNPPAVSDTAKKPESNPKKAVAPAAKPPAPAIPWKPVVQPPAGPAVSVRASAVSDAAKKPESNPKKPESKGAVRVPAAAVRDATKKPKSNPTKPPAVVTASNAVPRVLIQPLFMMPLPNTPAPRAPGPAVSAAAPRPSPPALNPLPRPADKAEAASTVRTPPLAAPGPLRGPMPARLKDAVPRVTAILVSMDRRFATVDGGQIIGIGDLLGRRTVIGMDERSVVLQEPSGVQIRIGLGGRLLGIERAAR
jgi:hypothetical protein